MEHFLPYMFWFAMGVFAASLCFGGPILYRDVVSAIRRYKQGDRMQ